MHLRKMYKILFVQRGFKSMKFYKKRMGLLALVPPGNFAIFESQYLYQYYTVILFTQHPHYLYYFSL